MAQEKRAHLVFDIDKAKNEFKFQTDTHIVKSYKRKEIQKNVTKELKKIEKMFPIKLTTKNNRGQSRNDCMKEMRGEVMSTYNNQSKFNQYITDQ